MFWKSRPDDVALRDPSLEVVLADAATLVDLEPALVAPGALPDLWKTDAIRLSEVAAYFSGKHCVQIDKGGLHRAAVDPWRIGGRDQGRSGGCRQVGEGVAA
jgi:hypothetical protein